MVRGLLALLVVVAMFPVSAFSQCPKSADTCVTTVKPINGTGPGTVTSTSYDNRAHAEAVSNATSAIMMSTLTYFSVTRPTLQTIRNNRTNRLEGQFTYAYELLDLLAADRVQSQPRTISTAQTIKKHHLGETWQDFLSASPYLQTRATQCISEKRPNIGGKPKKIQFNPCSDIWLMTDSPNSKMILSCLESRRGAGKDMICQDFNGEVAFENGKLVSLKVVVLDEWAAVLPDIMAKFGQPDGQDENRSVGIWAGDHSYVLAMSIEDGSAIAWMTPEKYEDAALAGRQTIDANKQTTGNRLD